MTSRSSEKQKQTTRSYQYYYTKAAFCKTKVRQAIVLTLALMFLASLSAMYSAGEAFPKNILHVVHVHRNASSLKADGSSPSAPMINSQKVPIKEGNQTKTEHYNNDFDSDHKLINNEKSQSAESVKRKTATTLRKEETAIVKGYQGKGSKEFPGMPDPCATARRNTGVEDILCMKRPQYLPEYKNPCWMDNSTFRCLPYFHLIGTCKCGTSDFFKRLLLHPDIIPNKGHFDKETGYWSRRRFITKNRAGKMKLGMTLTEFTAQFFASKIRNGVDEHGYHNKITGHGDPRDIWDRFLEEATPQNVPGAEELLWTTPYAVRHINPNVKLLLMFRDPIERLYSHYFHSEMGTSAKSFHEHVKQSIDVWKKCLQGHSIRHCIYSRKVKVNLRTPLYTSFYVVHLREWLKVFSREQLFIFRNEDYSSDIKGTMRKIFSFLNVSVPDEPLLNKMELLPHFYETQSKKIAGPMFASTRALLVDLYKPYTEELAALLKDEKFAFRDRSFA